MADYYMLAQEHIREALREAERERLVHLVEGAAPRWHWSSALLAALGSRLAASGAWLASVGAALESRYARTVPPDIMDRMAAAAGRSAHS